MKLEKFYAESMPKAMMIIQKKLGPEAVIYSQVKSDNFVEVVAGLPRVETKSEPLFPETPNPIKTSIDDRLIQIEKLSHSSVNQELRLMEKRNLLQYRLLQLKFSHAFIDRFVETYEM